MHEAKETNGEVKLVKFLFYTFLFDVFFNYFIITIVAFPRSEVFRHCFKCEFYIFIYFLYFSCLFYQPKTILRYE